MTSKRLCIAVLLMLALTWASGAFAQNPGTLSNPPTEKETLGGPSTESPSRPEPSKGKRAVSGTVTMNIIQAGVVVSASGGDGVLTFRNKRYPFRIGGIGIGVLGGSRAHATGVVYNLTRIEDFGGTFVKGQTGYAFGEGKSSLWLENTNGVVLRLDSTTKGVSLSFSGEGLVVEMGKSKKPVKQ